MNTKQQTKLVAVFCVMTMLSIAAGLVLYALKQNINLFYTPTQLLEAHDIQGQTLRLGGYVKKQSLHYDASGTRVSFTIMDNKNAITVRFSGVLPNLFREGQGVVVTGKLTTSRELSANEVLAKHDEKYMPPPLTRALEQT